MYKSNGLKGRGRVLIKLLGKHYFVSAKKRITFIRAQYHILIYNIYIIET